MVLDLEKSYLAVPSRKRQEFWDWCDSMNITCEFQGAMSDPRLDPKNTIWYDNWKIQDEQKLLWARLTWQ